mmetsp:Transcript_37893/g.80941  ORF Transcript_37893/g.80941 Transcript_37893/m.80941 type:complete len:404 (-) Transcript_37893:314-1525(-)|eukprot:CAMPEP_0172552788 /NCGR_PEP_ID=MMETSP1067-20121228/47190_1 /TAXON_ID=265564 ORGANISM="Thalassiosira punctigera, Strain Tpunct2005C2" /NCGR_SAMPLE_ID=MMETSP1067 /ASSEMBLY_ACC=CAM_ASM_000444 /LENGTH=403 /DNA_ID=CAMNT_0013340843 /DNA_START=164 /DNA_END=1375 /DNA_ORIENTATION=+
MTSTKRLALLAAAAALSRAVAFRTQIRPAAAARPAGVPTTTTTTGLRASDGDDAEGASAPPPLSSLVNRVAVAGATGRTGRFVVRRLLDRNVPVLAMVRDAAKASELFPANDLLTVRATDLGSEEDVVAALGEGGTKCDAAIWAATGFSDAPDQSFLDKLKAVFGLATNAQGTIDAVGLPALGKGLAETPRRKIDGDVLPKVVMLSSAGVTRPDWSEEKKEALEGCAGIPIVRLNPFGILGVKKESEEKLRGCGVDYCIFRPGGLNDKWSPNQRPIFSQGDVAVGRINRQDVAKILVDCLSAPEATGKTFEGVSIANGEGYYPPAASIGPALARLTPDIDNGGKGPSEEVTRATYAIMQQLLPGEKQEANKLAMGQTYEQLDVDEQGTLGERGTEEAPIKPTA